METTQIYDILLTILNNGTEKIFKQLGVTDIATGKKKLLSLDTAGVRDLYEAIRPTPKPRKRTMRTPSAEAIRLGFIDFENRFDPDSNFVRKDVFWWWSMRW